MGYLFSFWLNLPSTILSDPDKPLLPTFSSAMSIIIILSFFSGTPFRPLLRMIGCQRCRGRTNARTERPLIALRPLFWGARQKMPVSTLHLPWPSHILGSFFVFDFSFWAHSMGMRIPFQVYFTVLYWHAVLS
jgi:hypothetical protein